VDNPTRAFVLNAWMKLSVRFSAQSKERIGQLIAPFQSSMSLELQQRSTEYGVLLGTQWDGLRSNLLDKMPVLDEAAIRRRRAAFDEGAFADETSPRKPASSGGAGAGAAAGGNALDLNGIFGAGGGSVGGASSGGGGGGGGSLLDLDDIFGGGPSSSAPSSGMAGLTLQPQASPVRAAPAAAPVSSSNHDLLSDIFSSPAPAPAPVAQQNNQSYNHNQFGSQMLMPTPASSSPVPMQQQQMYPPQQQQMNMNMGMGMGMGTNQPAMMSMMPPAAPAPTPVPAAAAAPVVTPMISSSPSAASASLKVFDKGGLQVSIYMFKFYKNDIDYFGVGALCNACVVSATIASVVPFMHIIPLFGFCLFCH
jgi:hypothetical protein